MEKHIFSLFYANLDNLVRSSQHNNGCLLDDKELVHRLGTVLRLTRGEQCILFDQKIHALCTLTQIDGKKISITIEETYPNTVLAPEIICLLPLLRKEAFEEAIYGLTELGANQIHSVLTTKTQRAWGGQKEVERIARIMQAAAEQSKNFIFPTIEGPFKLTDCVQKLPVQGKRLFFDPEGTSLLKGIEESRQQNMQTFTLLIGPEGDLSDEEKDMVTRCGFEKITLTPTILRAQQAIIVATGALRSLLRSY